MFCKHVSFLTLVHMHLVVLHFHMHSFHTNAGGVLELDWHRGKWDEQGGPEKMLQDFMDGLFNLHGENPMPQGQN